MKLTKDERYTAYVIMLYEAENRNEFWDGLCDLIDATFHFWLVWHPATMPGLESFEETLPELFKKRTTDDQFATWFPETDEGWISRRETLTQCILETHP